MQCHSLRPWATALLLAGATTVASAAATTVYRFDDHHRGPYWTEAELIADQNGSGNFYTTTARGGTRGLGTILEVTPSGATTRLYNFNENNLPRGTNPTAPLLQIGYALYGTTEGYSASAGSVFRFNPGSGNFKILHTFATQPLDGQHSTASLMLGSDGYLWGTTIVGGSSDLNGNSQDWSGTIFKVKPDGSGYTLVHDFSGGASDGKRPYTPLVETSPGVLHGTAPLGGTADMGVIYRVDMATSVVTVAHSFGAPGDGTRPYSGLLKAGGKLYGTTTIGGTYNEGTVYEFDEVTGTVTPLHHFNAAMGDGKFPYGELMQASNGRVYGTTSLGGPLGGGTVWELIPGPTPQMTVLHAFQYGDKVDGYEPHTGLVEGPAQTLYGTTYRGGGRDEFRFHGTIYKVDF